jgi:murein L,D-transpeptidase YcbB/YkuD
MYKKMLTRMAGDIHGIIRDLHAGPYTHHNGKSITQFLFPIISGFFVCCFLACHAKTLTPFTPELHPQCAQWTLCLQDMRTYWANTQRPVITVHDLDPNHPDFTILVQTLQQLHFLPKDPEPVIHGSVVDILAVQNALKTLQGLMKLPVTGVLDEKTVDALNTENPILMEKIDHVQKEWQKMGPLPKHYILCNIPAFTLDVMDHGVSVLHSRVMVGKVESKTPEFSGFIYSIVFNPTWVLPHSQYKIYGPLVGTDGYYWHQGKLLQKPGPKNHLGQVKFLTRRPDAIILHSTHEPELFADPDRAYSIGCIRVQSFQDLAEQILSRDGVNGSISIILDKKIQKNVTLKHPFPVYAVYRRLWIQNGVIQYFSDVYGHDLVKKIRDFGPNHSPTVSLFQKPRIKNQKKQIH